MRLRSYREMLKLSTFEERFDYLQLKGSVGTSTFGHDRYLNQRFYTSQTWRRLRDEIIVRDNGSDLAIPDREIYDRIIIHHMNPISVKSLVGESEDDLNPDFLVCVTHNTHNAIHYGDKSLLVQQLVERRPGDTKLWSR